MHKHRRHVVILALGALALAIAFFWAPSDVDRVKEASAEDLSTATLGAGPAQAAEVPPPIWKLFEKENRLGSESELPAQF